MSDLFEILFFYGGQNEQGVQETKTRHNYPDKIFIKNYIDRI